MFVFFFSFLYFWNFFFSLSHPFFVSFVGIKIYLQKEKKNELCKNEMKNSIWWMKRDIYTINDICLKKNTLNIKYNIIWQKLIWFDFCVIKNFFFLWHAINGQLIILILFFKLSQKKKKLIINNYKNDKKFEKKNVFK